MAPIRAKPGRYLVDRRGTPDPEDSAYYVINAVHDPVGARGLEFIARSYLNRLRAQESSISSEITSLLDPLSEAPRVLPDRFEVEVMGDLDPADSRYYVINLVYDWVARAGLWWLSHRYEEAGASGKAKELRAALTETDEACTANIAERNQPIKGRVGRPKSARSQRR